MCIRILQLCAAALGLCLACGCETPVSPYDTSAAPDLLSPPDSFVTEASVVTFEWRMVADATHYELQVGRDGSFETPSLSCGTLRTSYAHAVDSGRVFCWRVRAKHGTQTGAWSPVRVFVRAQSTSGSVPQ